MNQQPSLKKSFYITKEMVSKQTIKENMNNSLLCSDNFYLLILSILIICTGLDKGSTIIIIGGMVMTPILGSIFSLAYGIAAKDKSAAYHAAYNYLGNILITIVISTLYFVIAPSSSPNYVMLTSISFSYHAIVISLLGGMTITIGFFYNQRLVPFIGTSIATTLAPPLCMIGYGISQLHMGFLLAAARMFFANSFFIFLPCLILFYILLNINNHKSN